MQGPTVAAETKHCARPDLQVSGPEDSIAEGPAEVQWYDCKIAQRLEQLALKLYE